MPGSFGMRCAVCDTHMFHDEGFLDEETWEPLCDECYYDKFIDDGGQSDGKRDDADPTT